MAGLPPAVALPQDALLDRWRGELAAGATRVGWKIGHDIPEVEAYVGDRPVLGYLTSRTTVKDGGTWPRQGSDLRAETEFAVSVAAEVDPAGGTDAARDAIAGLCLALEIVDLDYPPGDIEAVMQSDVFHRAVVFGPTVAASPDDLGPATLRLDDSIHDAREPIPDPVWVVRRAADVLGQFGERLLPGDRILSGSFVHQRIGDARSATAAIEGLGRVSLMISGEILS
jgi:2-keto-4-pentenoate hydratase